MDEKNLMQEMRERFYPYDKQTQNLTEALEFIKDAMQSGDSHIEFWTFWTDLPDDWVVEWDTLDKLKEQGFTVIKRWWNKGQDDEYYSIIVAWDDFERYTNDEDY